MEKDTNINNQEQVNTIVSNESIPFGFDKILSSQTVSTSEKNTIINTLKEIKDTSIRNKDNISNLFSIFSKERSPEIDAGYELNIILSLLKESVLLNPKGEETFKKNPEATSKKILGIVRSHKVYQKAMQDMKENLLYNKNQESNLNIISNTYKNALSINKSLLPNIDVHNLTIPGKDKTYTGNQFFELCSVYIKKAVGDNVTNEGIEQYIRYQLYLQQKAAQAKTDPTIQLTTTEQQTATGFSSFLEAQGIAVESFFDIRQYPDIHSKEANADADANAKTNETNPNEPGSLANLSVMKIPSLDRSTAGLPNIFSLDLETIQALIAGIELPEITTKEISQRDTSDPYTHLQARSDRLSGTFPFISPISVQLARDSLLLQLCKHADPSLPQDRKQQIIASLLTANEQKQYIDQTDNTLDIPTLTTALTNNYNTLLSQAIDSQSQSANEHITQAIGPQYLQTIQGMVSGEVGAQFVVDSPDEITITPDGRTIDGKIAGEAVGLTLHDGQITLDPYPCHIDGNGIISRGPLTIGAFPSLADLHRQITPDPTYLLQSTADLRIGLNDQIAIAQADLSKQADYTSASLRHTIASFAAFDTSTDQINRLFLSYTDTKNNPGLLSGPIPDEKQSDFGRFFYHYNHPTGEALSISPELNNGGKEFAPPIATLIQTILPHSADENIRFADQMRKLTALVHNPDLRTRYTTQISTQSAERSPYNAILPLLCADPPDPLQAFGALTNPDEHPARLLDLGPLISQLSQYRDGSQDITSFRYPLHANNPSVTAFLDRQIQTQADADLEHDLALV